jgi:glycosyl transferase family 2
MGLQLKHRNATGFAFLCCVSDEDKLHRLRESISALDRPPRIDVELFVETAVGNLAAGYNALMRRTATWRYKAYIHQDVVILNRSLLIDALRLFRRRGIAMIGPAGCRYLPPSCVWWDGSGIVGRVLVLGRDGDRLLEFEQPREDCAAVEAADGLCLITQCDLPWDEEMPGFHFYDVAQCARFTLDGYDVVVPRQAEPWFAHEETVRDEVGWREYYAARDVFRARYGERRLRFARARFRRRAMQALARSGLRHMG